MSSSHLRLASIVAFASLAVAACSNDGPPSSTAAPVPGDLGPVPGAAGESVSDDVGPRADHPPSKEGGPMRANGKKDPKDSSLKLDPAKMDPTTFVPKEYCLMPKLSMCSAYGERYERLASVSQFCASLGGEKAGSCPDAGRVARCITPANVITSYYSSGEKPYTKESGEAKCNEKKWTILP